MQKRKKILIVLLVLFPILLSNCSDPVAPVDDVAPELIGEWYYLESLSPSAPSPTTAFYGVQINKDKTINPMGIETITGKVSTIKNSGKKIIKANEGKLTWEFILEGIGLSTITYFYKIENEKLILSRDNEDLVYTKTKIGTQLFDPVYSDLSLEKDSVLYENNKIYGYPSAYVSISGDHRFYLTAEMNHAFLNIEIDNFNGTGRYGIQNNKFEFGEFYGDVGIILVPDSLSKDEIIITQYDEVNSICSGTFYLNATMLYNPDSVITLIKEGKFTVPIYK